MGTWGAVIMIFVAMWLLQIVLTLIQSRHYSGTIREMSAYGPGYLGVGVAKRKLGVGSVVVMVADMSGKVVEAREMTGVTLFARFRRDDALVGRPVEALEALDGRDSKTSAIRMAVERIREQRSLKNQEHREQS